VGAGPGFGLLRLLGVPLRPGFREEEAAASCDRLRLRALGAAKKESGIFVWYGSEAEGRYD